ncbi:substrate-binding domain-containing protein [Candidatus Moduliflexota bacterium]
MKIGGTGAGLGVMKLLGEAFREETGRRFLVLPSIGSGGAIRAVRDGAIDLGITSRPLRESEESADIEVIEIGRTPLVFAAHPDCSCLNVTEQRLVDIYSGREKSWSLGRRIRVILRPPRESDTIVLRSISPEVSEAVDAALGNAGLITATTDQDAADYYDKLPGAFGTSTLLLLRSEGRKAKVIPYKGVDPGISTIADGSYPLVRELSFVVSARRDPAIIDFIDFVFSSRGLEILRENGCLPSRR